ACWQQSFQRAKDPMRPVMWAPLIIPALLLGAGFWSVMLLVLAAVDLPVPIVTSGATLLRVLAVVTVLHLVVMVAASYMPRDAGRRRQAATVLSMLFSAGCAAAMFDL